MTPPQQLSTTVMVVLCCFNDLTRRPNAGDVMDGMMIDARLVCSFPFTITA
jgi:hypothetical protein